jgi:Zn-dependent metalloprotease
MKTLFSFLLCLFVCNIAISQSRSKHHAVLDGNGNAKSVEFDASTSSPANADKFFEEFVSLESKDSFKEVPGKSTGLDERHEIYDQYYNGVQVTGGGYVLHFSGSNLKFAQGNFIRIKDLNTTPRITQEAAARAFASHLSIPYSDVKSYKAKIIIKRIEGSAPADVHDACVYETLLDANHPANDQIGYVDVTSGEVVTTESMFTHVAATGTFATRYNGTKQAITENINGSFRLEDLTRGAPITTWNLNGSISTADRVHITDNDNNWTAAEHSASENDMGLDVHWGLQKIYDHLSSRGINSLNNAGIPITAYIKYGTTNAAKDNSGWHVTEHYMQFGDGAVRFRPMASLDIVGHECGHGIIDLQANWGTTGNQRAFHEGMADIWGAIFEYRINGVTANNWKIGEQLALLNKTCARNLQFTNDATADARMSDTFQSSQYNGNSDSYFRSGVLSHWFYMLVNGESGTNELGTSYNVTGIGMDKAQEIVQKAIFSGYLNFVTTYPDLRTAIINATIARYCNNSSEVAAVTNAWYAAGVGTAYSGTIPSITGNDPICNSQAFSVQNQIAGTTAFWSSGNTSQMTVSPQSAVTTTTATRVNNYNGQVNLILTMAGGSGCSNVITRSLQVGAFNSGTITVTGQAAVCPGNLYTYTANVPGGHRAGYTYTWTRPANWTVNTQNANTISYYVPMSSPDYGPVQVSVNNGCGLSAPSGITAFPGFGCGGFILSVFPNPTSSTLTIQLTEENSESSSSGTIAKSDRGEFTADLVNDRGKKVASIQSTNKVAVINTNQFSKGLYFLNVLLPSETLTRRIILE